MENVLSKCPKCGATDISVNEKTGKLRCNFCRFEFDSTEVNKDSADTVFALEGEQISAGLSDLSPYSDSLITLKCTACGAEVVIDTNETLQARCHWCRNTLSINARIENGAAPDMILPFQTPKSKAKDILQNYINSHRFFAHPQFKKEFSAENIIGVYFPYMVVDANLHAVFEGTGEIETRRYTVKHDKTEETYYDADFYRLGRQFDLGIDDLTVESSSARMDGSESLTNNIINAILPFDTENCVDFNANYMKGFNSERRDVNIDDMREVVGAQIKDIARVKANGLAKQYDRGICWDSEKIDLKGLKWKAAYLPVWLYSYFQPGSGIMHYVAVNARTNETVGSIPINKVRLVATSTVIEIISFFVFIFCFLLFDSPDDDDESLGFAILLVAGFAFYFYQFSRYRRMGDRHFHEEETRTYMKGEAAYDKFVEKREGLSNSRYEDANENRVEGVILGKF